MKKRKNIIKAGLLGSALLLGTGYAAVNSKEINIIGTVSAADIDLNLYIGSFQGDDFDCVEGDNTFTITLKEGKEFSEVDEVKSFSFDIGTNVEEFDIEYKFTTTITNSDFFR